MKRLYSEDLSDGSLLRATRFRSTGTLNNCITTGGLQWKRRLNVRLCLAPCEPSRFLQQDAGRPRVFLGFPAETECVFDTGATQTFLPLDLAQHLGIKRDPMKAISVRVADGRTFACVFSTVAVLLGHVWEFVPCVVPLDRTVRRRPLIGMEGLLSKYVFCCGDEGIELFRRLDR